MITIKSPREVETMAAAGRIVAETLAVVARAVRPGVSTEALDRIAEQFIRSHPGALPSFKGLYDFPATLCTSINQEVVHGIPSPKRILKEGDLLSVDVGVWLDGLHADSAATFPVLRGVAGSREAAAGDAERSRPVSRRRAPATTSATSATRCSGWRRGRGIPWCGSWWGTVSGRVSTRSPRCPTTASPTGARASWPG
jgi:methionine aminopeptidase